jgi:hypothetical protein
MRICIGHLPCGKHEKDGKHLEHGPPSTPHQPRAQAGTRNWTDAGYGPPRNLKKENGILQITRAKAQSLIGQDERDALVSATPQR